jgi:phage repressor protein C with HTH and peptisase S24 domain
MAKGKKKTGLGKRITLARERAGLSQTALGAAFKLTRSAVSQWESELTEPTPENLRGIAIRTGVDFDWLATGRGSPTADEIPGEPTTPVHSDPDYVHRPPGGIIELDVRAGLGGGGTVDQSLVVRNGNHADPIKPESWRFPTSFVRNELRRSEDRIRILETYGDSMSPTIQSGDRVIIDTDHRMPSPDGLYAIRDRFGSIVVKRLQVLRRGDPPIVKIISDNPHHGEEEVSAEEIETAIIGRVLWGLKRL